MMLVNSYNFAAPSGSTDPNFANVSLLLHMQGSNGGTTFTDSSSNTFTVTPFGNAQTSTAQYKWGSASGLFDGTGDYLTVPANAAFNFGTGDFTIEWWYRYTSLSDYQYFFDIGSNGTALRILNGNVLLGYAGGGVTVSATITTLSTGVWYHMAYVRSGSTHTFYIDGVSKASASYAGSAGSGTDALTIGNYGGGGAYSINGYVQDFRVTKAVARDPAEMPAPEQFPDS